MGSIIITDVSIFQGNSGFIKGSLHVSGDRIWEILPGSKGKCAHSAHIMHLPGRYVIPGLIDIHTHGNSGFDFSDGSREALYAMGRYLAAHGVTSFLPTSAALPYEKLETAFLTAAEYMRHRPENGFSIGPPMIAMVDHQFCHAAVDADIFP